MLARRILSPTWLAALSLSLALPATPALAQNAAVFKAGDALMQCLQSAGEVRPAERAADLAHSVGAANDYGWVPSEVSPGIWRLDRKDAGFGLSMEIRLVTADGNAHCIAFGPELTQADADAAADRFASSGRLGSIGSAALGQGMSRRYVIGGLSYTAELLSYVAPGTGAVVGLSFAGVSPQTVSALQGSAQQDSSQQASNAASAEQSMAMAATALRFCIMPGADGPVRANMFRGSGFAERVDRNTGNSDTTHYFTTQDGTISVELYYGEMPSHCIVDANNLGVTSASQVLDQVVPQLYPTFSRVVRYGTPNAATGQPAQCVTYEEANPIGYAIGAVAGGNANGCVDNGTASFFMSARV